MNEYRSTGGLLLTDKPGKHGQPALTGWELVAEFVFNGTVHFGQNIIAFVLLSLVSPVTYSVASLIKRIFVILMAIAWFGNRTTNLQACGIALTYGPFSPGGGIIMVDKRIASSDCTSTIAPAIPHARRSR